MPKQYEFSRWVRVGVSAEQKPRWWEFWKSPRLLFFSRWERQSIALTEAEAQIVMQADADKSSALYSLIAKLSAGQDGDVWGLQLEEQPAGTGYIPTRTSFREEW